MFLASSVYYCSKARITRECSGRKIHARKHVWWDYIFCPSARVFFSWHTTKHSFPSFTITTHTQHTQHTQRTYTPSSTPPFPSSLICKDFYFSIPKHCLFYGYVLVEWFLQLCCCYRRHRSVSHARQPVHSRGVTGPARVRDSRWHQLLYVAFYTADPISITTTPTTALVNNNNQQKKRPIRPSSVFHDSKPLVLRSFSRRHEQAGILVGSSFVRFRDSIPLRPLLYHLCHAAHSPFLTLLINQLLKRTYVLHHSPLLNYLYRCDLFQGRANAPNWHPATINKNDQHNSTFATMMVLPLPLPETAFP